MVVTHLALELCFQGKKLRGFTCKLTRLANGFLPESSWIITVQVLLLYLVSGLDMVAAGMVMDPVQVWNKYIKVCLCFYARLHEAVYMSLSVISLLVFALRLNAGQVYLVANTC